MNSLKLRLLCLCIGFFFLAGCSGSSSSVTPDTMNEALDSMPFTGVSLSDNEISGTGLLGAYELTINPESQTAELIPKRASQIGESFAVNGIAFFTITPCNDCFSIKSIKWNWLELIIEFELKHPLPKGNTDQPPSASNRLDLDVFDVAALIKTTGPNIIPVVFDLNFKKAYSAVTNADFYTGELENLLGDLGGILPAVLVIDNAEMGLNTKNKFEMGTTETFEIKLLNTNDTLSYDIYLTFGYGVSATWKTRFEPKYYNPEFNRKAAWKIDAIPLGFWIDDDNTTTIDVEVKVWDWQIWATVSTEPDFANADPSHVYAASRVDSVSVEIPGMNNALPTVDGTSAISGSGTPLAPLVYHIPVKNSNLISQGYYFGLVKVLDQRSTLLPEDNRDILIDSTDGILLDKYEIPEYASYQVFIASVESGCSGYCWSKAWGSPDANYCTSVALDDYGNVYAVGEPDNGITNYAYFYSYTSSGYPRWEHAWDSGNEIFSKCVTVDDSGNTYISGYFKGTCEFSPSGSATRISNGLSDGFLSKFDLFGNWQWTKTWGSSDTDECQSVDVNSSGDIYVYGDFEGTVEFNPDGGGSQTSNGDTDIYLSKFNSDGDWLMTHTWGGTGAENGSSISIDLQDNIYAVGEFSDSVEFNPEGGGLRGSDGFKDSFLNKFDSNDTWQWAKSWGGVSHDSAKSVAAGHNSDIYICGTFNQSADFNPDGGGTETAWGTVDCYLTKFISDGSWLWAKTYGWVDIETVSQVAINQFGDIFISGNFSGTCNFNPDGTENQTAVGQYDAYISKFDPEGNWHLAKTWGGPFDENAQSVAVDYYGNAFVGGYFAGTTNLNPDGTATYQSNGEYDCFLSKLKY